MHAHPVALERPWLHCLSRRLCLFPTCRLDLSTTPCPHNDSLRPNSEHVMSRHSSRTGCAVEDEPLRAPMRECIHTLIQSPDLFSLVILTDKQRFTTGFVFCALCGKFRVAHN